MAQARQARRWRSAAMAGGGHRRALARPGRSAAALISDQRAERDRHHGQADGRGAGVVVLLQLDDDQQRRDLGLHRHVAGDEDHRAVLADRAGEGQADAARSATARAPAGSRGPPAAGVGAQGLGRLLHLAVEVLQHRLQRAHHERQADEHQGDEDAERRIGGLDPDLGRPARPAGRSARRWRSARCRPPRSAGRTAGRPGRRGSAGRGTRSGSASRRAAGPAAR